MVRSARTQQRETPGAFPRPRRPMMSAHGRRGIARAFTSPSPLSVPGAETWGRRRSAKLAAARVELFLWRPRARGWREGSGMGGAWAGRGTVSS